jgi:hypothetical protein
MTLKQACSSEYQGAQDAFKDSMIHWILQFTLLIAFRCVLHRCESQEIRCWKLYIIFYISIHSKTHAFYEHRPWRYKGRADQSTAVPKSNQSTSQVYNRCTIFGENKNMTSVHNAQIPRASKTACSKFFFNNDPSAGSPTETLLRLLLPLNDQVWSTSQQQSSVAGSPKPIQRPH